jgi:nucleoside-diphosphate-sugar epimerase
MAIVVIGASGYIGQYLVAELYLRDAHVKVMSRSIQRDLKEKKFPLGVELIEADLNHPESLVGLLDSTCIVINLAYLWDSDEAVNLAAISNLTTACKTANVKRLIHLSTAMVTGRTNRKKISEEDICNPVTEYAVTKFKLEQAIIKSGEGCFDTVILRPTAVFGPGSENLKKLASDLLVGSRIRNYLKSCLFDKRRMNLVHIANVVGAIVFLQKNETDFNGQVFIVSDAEAAQNNFREVERFLMREFSIPDYRFPRLVISAQVLRWALSLMGKDNINPQSDYVSTKLADLGYQKPMTFELALLDYAASYRSTLHP